MDAIDEMDGYGQFQKGQGYKPHPTTAYKAMLQVNWIPACAGMTR